MIKKQFRLLCLIISLILLLSSFVSCTPEQDTTETTVSESAPTENSSEGTTAEEDLITEFTLVEAGEAKMKIVRSAKLKATDAPVVAAVELRKQLNELTKSSFDLGDDWKPQDSEHDQESLEILIGDTTYPESAAVAAELGYGEYAIKAVGNKIVIIAYADSGYNKAINYLTNLIISAREKQEDGSYSVTLKSDSLDMKKVGEPMTASLPKFDGSDFSCVMDMGDNCIGLILDDVSASEYNAYIEKLTANGYKTHATNQIAKNLFATMYTDKYTVNAGYYAHSNQARVIIEPYEDDTLATLPTNDAPITTSQLTMIGVEGIYNGSYQQNGLCLLYRLSDGRFVVVDGGHQNNAGIYALNLINELRDQSKEYAKTDKEITIAAWIITHPHSDHQGMFIEQYKRFANFNIERIMSNFWSKEGFEQAQNTTSTFAPGTYDRFYKAYDIAKEIGADYIAPHVGQVYHFGDTKFEILYTIESFLPRVAASFNTASIVFRTITTDQSGKSTTAIITGDATGYTFSVCNTMYGAEMKCDIMQVAHHGATTSGLSDQTKKAYSYMKPATVLWPAGANYYPTVFDTDFNNALIGKNNPNHKETFIAGWQGNTVILPLPYTLGTAITNNIVEPKN